ncbi:MAG TPA: hypothetical protein VF829_02840 [Candidatus Paceibacterota bacterium]
MTSIQETKVQTEADVVASAIAKLEEMDRQSEEDAAEIERLASELDEVEKKAKEELAALMLEEAAYLAEEDSD